MVLKGERRMKGSPVRAFSLALAIYLTIPDIILMRTHNFLAYIKTIVKTLPNMEKYIRSDDHASWPDG